MAGADYLPLDMIDEFEKHADSSLPPYHDHDLQHHQHQHQPSRNRKHQHQHQYQYQKQKQKQKQSLNQNHQNRLAKLIMAGLNFGNNLGRLWREGRR